MFFVHCPFSSFAFFPGGAQPGPEPSAGDRQPVPEPLQGPAHGPRGPPAAADQGGVGEQQRQGIEAPEDDLLEAGVIHTQGQQEDLEQEADRHESQGQLVLHGLGGPEHPAGGDQQVENGHEQQHRTHDARFAQELQVDVVAVLDQVAVGVAHADLCGHLHILAPAQAEEGLRHKARPAHGHQDAPAGGDVSAGQELLDGLHIPCQHGDLAQLGQEDQHQHQGGNAQEVLQILIIQEMIYQ